MFTRRGDINQLAIQMAQECNDYLGQETINYYGSLDKLLKRSQTEKYAAYINYSSYHYTLLMIIGREYLVYNPVMNENGRRGLGLLRDNGADIIRWDDLQKLLGISYVSRRYCFFPKQDYEGTSCGKWCLAILKAYFIDQCVLRNQASFPFINRSQNFATEVQSMVIQITKEIHKTIKVIPHECDDEVEVIEID